MAQRDDLLRAVQAARTGDDLAAAVIALDEHDRHRTASLQQSRELDLSAADVRRTLEPLPAFERHTAATDWIGDYEAPTDYRTAMIAEASQWYRSVPREVLADREEFEEQALGHAYTAASRYGELALPARREFMQYIGYMHRQAASGLPQIQQTIDGNNAPAETPMPEEPFDNFAPPQNEFNGAVEGPDHQSQISSEQAPGIQELQSQQGGGSGFGSGPERPVEHSVSMDTADGYSEVPPGQPGQIATQTAGPAPSAPSTPNPMMSAGPQDAGAPPRPTAEDQQRQASYSLPDHEGFRWRLTASADDEVSEPVPFHAKCGALHWPDQACGNGRAHTASMAIGYVTSFEDQMRRDRFENLGSAEGAAVLRAVGTNLSKVAQHHNTLLGSFKAEARTEDEIAWLRGYMARVRPVLAGGGLQCEGCGQPLKPGKTGSCKNCKTAAQRRRVPDFLEPREGLIAEGAAWYSPAHETGADAGSDSLGDREVLGGSLGPFAQRMSSMAARDLPEDGLRDVSPAATYGAGAQGGIQARGGPGPGSRDGVGSHLPQAGNGLSGRQAVLAPPMLQPWPSQGEDARGEHRPGPGAQLGAQAGGSLPGGSRPGQNGRVAQREGRVAAAVPGVQATAQSRVQAASSMSYGGDSLRRGPAPDDGARHADAPVEDARPECPVAVRPGARPLRQRR